MTLIDSKVLPEVREVIGSVDELRRVLTTISDEQGAEMRGVAERYPFRIPRYYVENVLRVKKLLYDEGFTIAGARQQLKAEVRKKQSPLPFAVPPPQGRGELKQVRQGLREILGILNARH